MVKLTLKRKLPNKPASEVPKPGWSGDVKIWRVKVGRGTGLIKTNVPWSVVHHSPTGFGVGYGGSGPADLALNILNAFMPPGFDDDEPVKCWKRSCSRFAWKWHQDFKWQFIAAMNDDGGTITEKVIREWIDAKRQVLEPSR